MASGDNADVIEMVETATTNFTGPTQPTADHKLDQSIAEEDCEYSCPVSSPLFPSLRKRCGRP